MVAVNLQSIMATAVLGTTLFASSQADEGRGGSEDLQISSSFTKVQVDNGFRYTIRESANDTSKVSVKYGFTGDLSCTYPVSVEADTLHVKAECSNGWHGADWNGGGCTPWLHFIIEVPKGTLKSITGDPGSRGWINGDVLDHSGAALSAWGAHMNADLCSAQVNALDVKLKFGSRLIMGTNAKLSGSSTFGSELSVAGTSSLSGVSHLGGSKVVKTSSECSAVAITAPVSLFPYGKTANGSYGVTACALSIIPSSSNTTEGSTN